MKKIQVSVLALAIGVLFVLGSCEKSDDVTVNKGFVPEGAELSSAANENDQLKSGGNNEGFVHGLVVDIDGENYYFSGAPDGSER